MRGMELSSSARRLSGKFEIGSKMGNIWITLANMVYDDGEKESRRDGLKNWDLR